MDHENIPNSSAWLTDQESDAVLALLRQRNIGSNDDTLYAAKQALKHFTSGHDVLLTTSCTTAMELALSCLEMKAGDEVIVPSFTFVSTATAVLQAGGTPVFVDSESDTFNLDPEKIEGLITAKTRAIMPVHYAGVACDMDRIMEIAKKHNLIVIEDNAHGIGATYKHRALGTIGTFGAFSFHDTKNCSIGEGGALSMNDDAWKEKAELRYEKGTNRSAFLRGEVDKYTWISPGSSYVLSAILAELLRVQLIRLPEMNAARAGIVARYKEGLSELEKEGLLTFQRVPEYARTNHHIASFLTKDAATRPLLLRFLRDRGIGALFHYQALHLSPFATERLHTKAGDCPIAEDIAARIVRLPLFPHMTDNDVNRVIGAVLEFYGKPFTTVPTKPLEAGEPTTLDLSLVIACYNEAPHLHKNLDEIIAMLDHSDLKYELIVIDDKSPDETAERIREYVAKHTSHRIRAVYHEKNMGRGATVSEGMRMARGRYTGFIDVDLEIPARYLPGALLPLQSGQADMVLAERTYRFEPLRFHRYIMSVGYRWLTKKMLKIPKLDTEAGFKFFRKDALLVILDRCSDAKWFWDTEITVAALDAGLRIVTEPVLFHRKREKKSTVRFLPDTVRSFKKLLAYRKQRLAQSE